MLIILAVFYLNLASKEARAKMEGFVVKGENAPIEMFPYAAHLGIRCVRWRDVEDYNTCGSSIISNLVCLTAAHCLEDCENYKIVISVGHANKNNGIKTTAAKYMVHKKYNPNSVINDIALVKSNTQFKFSAKVSRVNIMPNVVYGTGYLAGWGYVNEEAKITTNVLKYTRLPYLDRNSCLEIIRTIPMAAMCAGHINGKSYAAPGDSGSALVVDNNQIGLVSYKIPGYSKSVSVFTDVPKYYNWIMSTMATLNM